MHISDFEMYLYEVKTNNAISLCDNALKSFALQDICLQTKSLKVSQMKQCSSNINNIVISCSHGVSFLLIEPARPLLIGFAGFTGVAVTPEELS